ncbi:hypothetical protein [Mucilaginibacter polytrichastri]|uniref:N-acetyltransferase domain-containing protein n=1 Tax=Mucilaginibacter polytrichastri TaxID=1302689 RepID=A0A1Q5ZYJ0_9SPHI|nr:hypothetical protein [Mucilaginibacter polytrichastri]OKS86812.1 hypothetical protein RG47T_2269 [Mucilaginibacter polytrichastri]SFT22802.1 hypothetical protein SAMN04487890_11963 [Mucilaginibacter polytrichastri]
MEAEVLTHKIVFITNFKEDKALIQDILDLTVPSYKSNMQLIEREVNHNRDIYIIRGEEQELLAFFMVNYEPVDGEFTYYLGLSACSETYKGKGLVKSLYLQLMHDCRLKEQNQGKKIMLWWTTATPIVYYWFNKHAYLVQPDMEGAYNAKGKQIAEKIVAEKFPTTIKDSQHPFILRSVATETNYSDHEVKRISDASKNLNMNVFENFNINEQRGDRFLMIGYAPDHSGY